MKARALFLDHVGALGGAELALIDVAKAYRDTSTFLLFSDGPFRERLTASGIKVAIIEGGRALHSVRRETRWPGLRAAWRVISLAWQVRRYARDHDLIHANSQKAFVVACLAGFLSRRPVIWDLNDLVTREHFSRTNIFIDVALANRCAVRVIANSRASADALIAEGGPRDKLRVVYNGIDPTPFDAVTPAQVEAARHELGLNGEPVIGVFGRLAQWKGQHVALTALVRLPGVHLLLVGDALFGETAYKQTLRVQAEELGIADRVHFVGFRTEIPVLMQLVDVVLHTSTSPEPFGRVIVEGMLARRPVIATRGGGVEEIIDHESTGILVTPGEPEELALAVGNLLGNPEWAAQVAAAGRAAAESKFTVAAMVNGMSENLEEFAAR